MPGHVQSDSSVGHRFNLSEAKFYRVAPRPLYLPAAVSSRRVEKSRAARERGRENEEEREPEREREKEGRRRKPGVDRSFHPHTVLNAWRKVDGACR